MTVAKSVSEQKLCILSGEDVNDPYQCAHEMKPAIRIAKLLWRRQADQSGPCTPWDIFLVNCRPGSAFTASIGDAIFVEYLMF